MAGVISVRLPDGSKREIADGTTAVEFAQSIGPRLAKAAIVATVDGHAVDLGCPLPDGAEVAIVTADSDAGRDVLRHSTAHVLAQAVLRLWPGAKYAIGPVIENGFYYDFELPGGAHFSDDDLARIENEMRAIMAEDQPFIRHEHALKDGLALFADQPFKREIIEAVGSGADEVDASGSVVSTYWNSDTFTDLCRGPHVPSTSRLGHFKLMRVAGAYWRGDEKRQQLQRIYGTAWESEKALAAHLHQLEEAERRDHRKLGAELDLFSFPEEVGPGLAIFHPKGGTIRRLMEEYSRQRHVEEGYEFVNSPHISKSDLFEISGHLDWFAEAMYPPMELDGGAQYYLKPMNCPFHILVYRSRQRSYRELPLRFFEFGAVYRYEKSGVVHGLTRVRGMTQDDAHIFCTREEMGPELVRTFHFVLNLLRDFGLNEFYLELSTKPPGKAVGSDQDWEEATETLRATAEEIGLDLVMDEGGGAFYGPENFGAGQGCDRPDVADVDRPARLPAPGAIRAGVHRRRQRPSPSDHDPPGAVRVGRALHGGAARALCRRHADLAVPRTGPGVARERSPRAVCGIRGGCVCRRRIAGKCRRRRGEPEGSHPEGEGDQGSLHPRRRFR